MDKTLILNGMKSRVAKFCRLIFMPFFTVPLLFFSIYLVGIYTSWIHPPIIYSFGTKNCPSKISYSLNCTNRSDHVCPAAPAYNPSLLQSCQVDKQSARSCPDYFRWIYEDLRAWKDTGITREMVEHAQQFAHFRLLILKGKVYLEQYRPCFQTRDVFTIWGIVQLVRLYPGQIPDLDLMFYCEDKPVIFKSHYTGENATSIPPLFHYCNSNETLDIVFPDWTFWGWLTSNAILEGNKITEWKDRMPYAFWKGNPNVSWRRIELMECNVTEQYDWNARLYTQDWTVEREQGFKSSDVSKQCTHRYKIFIEGNAWSVSNKYIMGCDSMTLLVEPIYYDFFMRGLVPLKHYWPIRRTHQCRDIKFAVEWGNNHTDIAQAIGRAGSNFIHENLKLENVYDYMFHLLHEYAKLLKYKPVIPSGAGKICSEAVACFSSPESKNYMSNSMVNHPSEIPPCTMPPPFDTASLEASREENKVILKRVEMWEGEYWKNNNNNNKEA